MAQYDGSIRINTKIDSKGIQKGISDIKSSIKGLSSDTSYVKKSLDGLVGTVKKLGSVVATAFVAGKISQFGKEAVEAASDLEAMNAQFSQVFGNMETAASKSLSQIAKQAGITEERMKASYTKIAAFAKTTGMDTAGSMELANRAMVAVADSAAFYDRSLEETTESLQSFLKGNYENDAALGLSATEYTRNAAANKLYGKSFQELSEAQKQLTLLQMVEDANKLSGAMGQASREADTWTNQTGNLNQAWTNLKANLGKFILPMAVQAVKAVTNVVNSLNALLVKLSQTAGAFRSFSELLTGNKASSGNAGVGAPVDGSDYSDAAAGAEQLADATDDAAKATKNAKKEAEGYLSPLDEINKIGKEEDKEEEKNKPQTGGGVPGAMQDIDYGKLAEGETIFDKMQGVIGAVVDKAKELAGIFKQGFFEGLGDYKPVLDGLKKDIISIGQTLKEIFADPAVLNSANNFANQFALTMGQITGSVASIGLTIAANLVGGMEKYLTQNTERIKGYIVEMLNIGTDTMKIAGNLSVALADIFSVFGGETAQQITGNLIGVFAEVGMMISENAAKLGRDILNMIAQPIIDNKEKIKSAIEGTLEAIEPFTSGFLTAIQKIRDAVSDIYDNHLKPLFDSIASGLSEILGKLLDGYNTYIVPVLQGLGDRFKELMEGPFGEAIDKVKDFIGKLIDALKLLWEEVLVPIFGWIADKAMPILADIIDVVGKTVIDALGTIFEAIGNIADILGGVIDFIVGVFTGDWERAWEGVKGIFSGIWELIKGIVSGAWEVIKTTISGAIDIVGSVISTGLEGIKTAIGTAWSTIKTIVSTGTSVIKAAMNALSKWLDSVFSKSWTKSFGVFGGVIQGFFKNVKNIFDDVKKIFEGVVKFVSGAFSGNWKQAWDGIKQIFSGIWDGFVDVVKSPINIIIGILNGFLSGIQAMQNGIASALNSLQIDIPDWLQGITGYSSLGFNLGYWQAPQIPYLAQGTVVPPNKEFLAMLGDNKREPEVVSPISTIEQAVKNAMSQMGSTSKEITIKVPLYLDGKLITEIVVKHGKLQQMSTGNNIFALG